MILATPVCVIVLLNYYCYVKNFYTCMPTSGSLVDRMANSKSTLSKANGVAARDKLQRAAENVDLIEFLFLPMLLLIKQLTVLLISHLYTFLEDVD